MASLITCPHCGQRPKEEFIIKGDAGPVRPQAGAPQAAFHAYVHLRDNVRGVMHEHWQHTGGCRRWLVVTRDTMSHAVHSVVDAAAFTRTQAKTKPAAVAKQQAAKPAPKAPRSGAKP